MGYNSTFKVIMTKYLTHLSERLRREMLGNTVYDTFVLEHGTGVIFCRFVWF